MAAIYYVSNNGSDSNDGLTLETAFATIDYAVSQVSEDTTINIGEGEFEVSGLPTLSSASGIIRFVGEERNTVLIVTNCTALSTFANSVSFYQIIFKASDNMTGDTRMLSYTDDSHLVNFYNCVFKKSDNGTYPTSALFLFHNNSATYVANKYFYNCSFAANLPVTYGYGMTYCYNCALDCSQWYSYNNGGYNCTDCVTNAIYDEQYQLTNYDNLLYGVYSGDYAWVIRQVFIKMNDKYYSISEEYYNTDTQMYEAFDNYNELDSLSIFKLFEEVTIGDETFRPIDKFSGNIQLVFNNEVSNVEITGYKSDTELIFGEMLDLRKFANIETFNANNSFKMAFCINESQWMSYDFDNNIAVPLDINIPLNKDYGQFTTTEKNNWYDAMLVIEEQGFTADKLSEIDFNQEGWYTIRVAYVLDTTVCEPGYERMGVAPTTCSGGAAVVYNNELHILQKQTHYKLDGTEWISVSKPSMACNRSQVVVYNNEIHILGQFNSTSSARKGHYKWDGTQWTKVGTLPYSLYDGMSVVYNNEIHILSSADNGKLHYKWDGTQWTSVSTLPYSFSQGSAIVYNNEIHIFRGTYHYKWDGTNWIPVSILPYSFEYGRAVVYQNNIHLLNNNNHCVYDDISGEWIDQLSVPCLIYQTPSVVYNNKIHLFGSDDSYDVYRNINMDYIATGSKYTNQAQDSLTLFNATEVGFENEQDGFSKTCENKQFPIFSDNASRIKTQDGVASDWWLTTNVDVETSATNEETGEVTTTTSTQAAIVSSDGTLDSSDHNVEKGICFGFNI